MVVHIHGSNESSVRAAGQQRDRQSHEIEWILTVWSTVVNTDSHHISTKISLSI